MCIASALARLCSRSSVTLTGLPHLQSLSVSPFAARTSRPHSGHMPTILRERGTRSTIRSIRSHARVRRRMCHPAFDALHRRGRMTGARFASHCHLPSHVPASAHACSMACSVWSSRSTACRSTGAGASPPCGLPPLPGSVRRYSRRATDWSRYRLTRSRCRSRAYPRRHVLHNVHDSSTGLSQFWQFRSIFTLLQ